MTLGLAIRGPAGPTQGTLSDELPSLLQETSRLRLASDSGSLRLAVHRAAVAACSVDMCEYEQDGEVAQRIAAVIPYYPYKGIPRFCAPHLTWRFDAWP